MDDFDIGNLIASGWAAVSQVADDVADDLFGTDSDDSGSDSDSSETDSDDSESDSDESETDAEDSESDSGESETDSDDSDSDSDATESLLGAMPMASNVDEDGQLDIDDVEDFFAGGFKLLVGAFIGSEELQEYSDQMDQEGIAEDANYIGDYYINSEELQERSDEMTQQGIAQETNNICGDFIGAEELQEQSDQMTQQGISQDANYAWNTFLWSEELQEQTDQMNQETYNQFNAPDEQGRDRVYVLGWDAGAANGLRTDGQVMIALDATHPNAKILGAGAAGPGSPAVGTSFFAGTGRSVDGLNGLMGGGADDGGSVSFASYDHSYSDTSDVQTVGVSLGSTDLSAEAHHTDTYTVDISGTLSEEAKQTYDAYEEDKAKAEHETNQYIQDQVKKGLHSSADSHN